MRDIVLPRKEGRNDVVKSRRSEKDSVAARDRRMHEFPLLMSSKTAGRIPKTEGWYSPKTTIYHIEDAFGGCVQRTIPKTSVRKTRIVQPCLGRSETAGIRSLAPGLVSVGSPLRILLLALPTGTAN
jgi:hypothetical protein